jgi:hypothetical protein
MSFLRLEDISAAKLATEAVEVPEWGGTVLLREWSAGEVLDYHAWAKNLSNVDSMMGLVARSLINEDGTKVFPDPVAGAEILKGKQHTVLNRLADVVSRLNKFDTQSKEELAKNSETSPSCGSPSDSPII